jgi:ribosomal-protein-alanine N-acetyltransferase
MTTLIGRRVVLRPLGVDDFEAWREVRRRNHDWLVVWEPSRLAGYPDVVEDRDAFAARCAGRDRERHLGSAFSFGVFVDGVLAGEMNLSSVQRGAFQSAYVGYWIDEAQAGHGYTPEALVALAKFAFEDLRLHRIQVSIIPRNHRSRRVAEKVGLRDEGTALRYLEINGVWEDHVRYGLTAEDWEQRRDELLSAWLD